MCERLNQEFEEFFLQFEITLSCNHQQMMKIIKPLKNHLLRRTLFKAFKVSLLLAAICFSIYFNDTLNWNFCAVGRIFLIKLLPIWNWIYLSSARCLIAKVSAPIRSLDIEDSILKDCRACENFSKKCRFKLLFHEPLATFVCVIYFRHDWRLRTNNLQFHS